MAGLMAPGTGSSPRKRAKWLLVIALLCLSSTMLPAKADDGFKPVGKQAKPYVADADLALIADQLAQENVKELTLEHVVSVFAELPRLAFHQNQVPPVREYDPQFPDTLLRSNSDSLSGRISLSDIRTAVVEESIPGDLGEQFLEEVLALFRGPFQRHNRKLLSKQGPVKGLEKVEISGGGRRLLAENVQSSGTGVTLTDGTTSSTSTSDSDSGKWGPLTKGAWIGIIIAVVFVIGAVTILCWCLECICCCCCF
ncbi:hypothetical protein KFL_002210220 [Klebsormidium nitens]|uniref:Uncharacterized protein n=1 Tax=Klebsormidium nitens TaxID=105231 RepID=A0A1Y1I8Y9_KLENI|nr:hypothetical protein KFL_002210220 [Klebsormidium nitens]|eukprot:GAQ85156.1 hypothetical protein KFL_002210220 [Klebsormidium nitens]